MTLHISVALVFITGAVEIYRNGNKDRKIDKDIKTKGFYGINFHRAGFGL